MKPEDYLYKRQGPWPQPSPAHPLGEAPAVIHLPKEENREWTRHIGMRYLWTTMTYWVSAGWQALTHQGLDAVPDAEFNDLMCFTPFTRFIRPVEDYDKEAGKPFAKLIAAEPDAAFYVADFTFMKSISSYDGMYCAPTVCLFKQEKQDYAGLKHAAAIYFPFSDLLLSPTDGNAWELAKYFVLQGANYRLVVSVHALLHFPFDSINAVTKTALPTNNLVFKLIYPHLQFTLVLNNAVLTSSTSPLVNNQWYPFAGFMGNFDEFQDFLVDSYRGMLDNEGKLNPSYPPFVFTERPTPICGEYDIFLNEYYQVFLEFAEEVIQFLPNEQILQVKQWANYINQWLPGFPNGEDIMKPMADDEGAHCTHKHRRLAGVLAKIMWDLSVAHSADHYNYSLIPISKIPLRMRTPPPASKQIPPFDRAQLVTMGDVFRQSYEREMFFRPANVTCLFDVDYGFDTAPLRALNNKFLENLRDVEARLKAQGITIYIPLDQIARSIQY